MNITMNETSGWKIHSLVILMLAVRQTYGKNWI